MPRPSRRLACSRGARSGRGVTRPPRAAWLRRRDRHGDAPARDDRAGRRDASLASSVAARAARSFAARGKPVNAALARTLCVQATLLDGSLAALDAPLGLAAAGVLEQAGWRRTRSGRISSRLRARSRCTRSRGATRARTSHGVRRRGTVTDRIELIRAEALLRLADGDLRCRRATCSRTDSGSSTTTEPRSAPPSFVPPRPVSERTSRG